MPGSQPIYGQFPFWNKLALPFALLLAATSACADSYEEAARRGAEADLGPVLGHRADLLRAADCDLLVEVAEGHIGIEDSHGITD